MAGGAIGVLGVDEDSLIAWVQLLLGSAIISYLIYMIWALIKRPQDNRKGSRIVLGAAALACLAVMHDLLLSRDTPSGSGLSSLCLTVVIVGLSLLVREGQQASSRAPVASAAKDAKDAPVNVNQALGVESQRLLAEYVDICAEAKGAEPAVQRARAQWLLIEAEEAIRRDVAELLHGRVQTRLLLAWHRLGMAERILSTNPEGAVGLIRKAREEIDAVREQDIRGVSHLLHPSIIRVGLLPAVYSLIGGLANDIEVDLCVDDALVDLDDPVKNRIPESVRLALYRVLEEALQNALRHGQASAVVIELRLVSGSIELKVNDNGRGFDAAQSESGLGLSLISARVNQVGGTWSMDSQIGGGTKLLVRLPLASVYSNRENSSL